MVQRKYTLPRHTNLASTSRRIGAFIVDLAIFLAITLGFYFGCFNLAFKSKTKPMQDALHHEQLNSHLRLIKDGKITQVSKDATYEELSSVISYYYLNFLTGDGIPEEDAFSGKEECLKEKEEKNYYTVSWYNLEVLNIKSADPDKDTGSIFTYQRDDAGNYDTSKVGIPRSGEGVIESDALNFMRMEFATAYTHLVNTKYMLDLNNKFTFALTAEFVASSIISLFISYILLPLFLHNGRTLGKKAFKLALANNDGYSFQDKQLLMRAMPAAVVCLALLIPIWSEFFYLLLVVMTIFLVSFALAMASPKHTSLHDFTARTIVIDDQSSIIFDNPYDEEEYTNKEDGLTPEEEVASEGEEPELKYEK